MPKVSIILPTYNGERYLKQAIDSILAQTYTDWELILVNDCSTDATADIVEQYAGRDARIRTIHNTSNQKLPASLNIGFAAARGEYFTWTSDDNLYLPDAIGVMAKYLDEHEDVSMVRASMDFIDAEDRIIGRSETYTDEKMYAFNCLGACFMYRRTVRDAIGDYDVNTYCAEDYDYWLRVLERFGTIMPIDQILYRYRRHGDSLSETKRKQVGDQLTKLRLRYIDKIFKVFEKNKGELCRIYFEMRKSPYMTAGAIDKFKEEIPELCGEMPLTEGERYIIFGAGVYGERAAKSLEGKIAFFADSDLSKKGTLKNGIEILPFQEATHMSTEYRFLIAVAGGKVYEMIEQLTQAGIKTYCVY